VDLPRDVAVTRKRPTWLHDTLQDAVRHATPMILSRRENDLRGSQVIWIDHTSLIPNLPVMRRSRWLHQW
jgi:hypothetical protein